MEIAFLENISAEFWNYIFKDIYSKTSSADTGYQTVEYSTIRRVKGQKIYNRSSKNIKNKQTKIIEQKP